MSDVTVSAEGVVTGNTYDKYGSAQPARAAHDGRLRANLDELLERAEPSSLLDVGCGEGVLVHQWAQRLQACRVVGIDLEEASIQAGWAERQAPNLEYRVSAPRTCRSPTASSTWRARSRCSSTSRIREHTLAEMARCAQRHLLVSVPREPLWRGLNMARGAYWSQLGNTPGHLNHWSRRSFVALLREHGEVVEVRSPFPWTMLLVRV